MRLYLVRHAIAEPYDAWGADDASRPLTAKGAKTARRIADVLERASVEPSAILASPLLRAVQTAEILAEGLGLPERLAEDPRLAPGFGPHALRDMLEDHADAQELMLVGHEPDLSDTVAACAGGARVEFKKAAVARLDIPEPAEPEGLLVWLAPPGLLAP